MNENIRLLFSAAWLVATGCLVATGLAVLVTWGDYLTYFYASLIAWSVATVGAIATSL